MQADDDLRELLRASGDQDRIAVRDRLEAMPREEYRAVLEGLADVADRTIEELERGPGVPETPVNTPKRVSRAAMRNIGDPEALVGIEPRQRIWLLWDLLDLAMAAERNDWVDPGTLFDLLRAGIDEDLLYSVRGPFWRKDPDSLRELAIVVGDQVPPVTLDQLRRAAAFGLALTIDQGGVFDLTKLEPVIGEFRGLHLYMGEYTGWEVIERAMALRDLRLVDTEPDAPLDLAHLPQLEDAGVAGKNVLSVASNPSLRRLWLNAPRLPAGFRVVAPLTELTLFTRKAPGDLEFLDRPEDLRELAIDRADEFDAAILSRSPMLESLKLACRELRNADALRNLPGLRVLHLEGCRSAPGAEVIAELPLENVEVYPNYLFDDAFQQRVRRLPGHWNIPALVRPSKRVTETTRARFEDGEDGSSFAPFVLSQPVEDGAYTLSFTDWDAVEERFEGNVVAGLYLNGHTMAGLLREAITDEAPELLDSVDFDSEGDGCYAAVRSLEQLEDLARIASRAWSNISRMRRYARRAADAQAAEAAAETE